MGFFVEVIKAKCLASFKICLVNIINECIEMADFSLANLSETTPLITTLKKALAKATGQAVAYTTIQKVKRVSGESTKDVDFGLENGQKVTFVIRQSGDVVRVKANDRDFPMAGDLDTSYKPSFNSAMDEIGTKIRSGQTAFEKNMAKEKVIIPRTASQRAASVTQQIKQKVDEEANIEAEILKATNLNIQLKAQLDTLSQRAVTQ